MSRARSWLLVLAAACGTRDRSAPASGTETPVAPSLAAFETAWDRTRTCLFGTDFELLSLDPRDALPLAGTKGIGGEEEETTCPDLDGLVAAVPPDAPELAAAVRDLAGLWGATSYNDDTGGHTVYGALEAFANALRDVDDRRIAVRRAANLPASSLGARRIPLATIGGALDRDASIIRGPSHEHTFVIYSKGELVFTRPDLSTPSSPAWKPAVDDKTHALTVSEPPGMVVSAKVDGDAIRHLGSGRDRAIVIERRDGHYTIFVSHDAGATWTIGLPPTRGARLDGDPRAFDAFVLEPPRWIRVGSDGIVAPAVPVTNPVPSQQWNCATAEAIWLVDGNANVAHWFDRNGKRGAIPYTGIGGFGCAGRDLLAHSDDGDVRCSADTGTCGDANRSWGLTDLVSDGIVAAGSTGAIITIKRSGAHPSTIRTRLQFGDELEGFVVWNDVPTLVIRQGDRLLHFATPAR